MGKRFSEIMIENKEKKLLMWRERYSKQEYPYKVAFNLLYELLAVEKMWDEIQNAYKRPLLMIDLNNLKTSKKRINTLLKEVILLLKIILYPL